MATICLAKCDDNVLVSWFKREADVFFELTISYPKQKYHFDVKYKILSKMKMLNPSFTDFTDIVTQFSVSFKCNVRKSV